MTGEKEVQCPYWYTLPQDRIAQRPTAVPESARLLLLNRKTGELSEDFFSGICRYLHSGDLLVFNDSRVLPARMFGENAKTGGRVELLLLEQTGAGVWSCLARPMKRLREGTRCAFGDLLAEIRDRSGHTVSVQFFNTTLNEPATREDVLARGCMPIPPYIRKGRSDEQDVSDYQSVLAAHDGSVAAPTASLHFSSVLINQIQAMGCEVETVTLHVGTASFFPVFIEGEDEPLLPGEERYVYSPQIGERISRTRAAGGRVVAVGTTTVRALESMAVVKNSGVPTGTTSLFIQPGYQFQFVDALITNFHQPGTTHLLLVEALIGRELLGKAYSYALERDFRFLSYGDGMLLF